MELFCSGLYGEFEFTDCILPIVKDSLYKAMEILPEEKWNAKSILDEAYLNLLKGNDNTIIGLGVLLKNPVIVTLLRESVVLYSDFLFTGGPDFRVKYVYKYIWNVSIEIEKKAQKIIQTFNSICPYKIPDAIKKNVKIYYEKYISNPIYMRCVRIGFNGYNHYHWAIRKKDYFTEDFEFIEFWDSKIWTTVDIKADFQQDGKGKINWDIS